MERIQYAVFPAMQSPSPRANRVMDTLGERETIRSGVMALRMIAKFGNPAMAGAASGSEMWYKSAFLITRGQPLPGVVKITSAALIPDRIQLQ